MVIYSALSYNDIAQRIFIYSHIQRTILTPGKILNSLVNTTLLYVNMYERYKLSKIHTELASMELNDSNVINNKLLLG